jgi:hypothetical protein
VQRSGSAVAAPLVETLEVIERLRLGFATAVEAIRELGF